MLVDNAMKGAELVAIRILSHVADSQLFGAQPHTLGDAAGDDGQRDPGIGKEAHPDTVLNIVALELETFVVDVAEVDAAIGQDAVDVKGNELDAASERRVKHT